MDQPGLFTTISLEKRGKGKPERDREAPSPQRKMREDEWEWKETEVCLRKNKDTGGVRRGGAWRVFIYTAGFMASCVCCVAWEPSPPGRRKQHHFKLECPLRRQVSCQNMHSCRIPRKSPDLFPNNRCVHLSHGTQKGLSLVTVEPLSPSASKRSQPTWLSHHTWARYATDLWGGNSCF